MSVRERTPFHHPYLFVISCVMRDGSNQVQKKMKPNRSEGDVLAR